MKSFDGLAKRALLVGAVGVFALATAEPASAQLYFRPFFQPFAYSYHDYPVEDEGPAPYASRRAVASILAREGYRLVGPLGHRGEQIVANGYSRRDGDMRFIVDPYEGRIIRGIRLGPPPDDFSRATTDDNYVPQLGGSRPVARELDRDESRAQRPRRDHRTARREAPEQRDVKEEPREDRAANPKTTPSPVGRVPASPPQTAEPAKPEERTATTPAEKPAPRVVYPPPPVTSPQPSTPEAAKPKAENTTMAARPTPAASTPSQQAQMPKTAHAGGGGSHRAIVPPSTGAASSATTSKPD